MKPLVVFLLLLVVPLPGVAAEPEEPGVDTANRLGLGLVSSSAPLGFRYLWNRRYGLEGGIGFQHNGGDDHSTIVLETAYLHAVAPGEKANAFLRPAVRFTDGGASSSTTLRFSLSADVEIFLTPSFSAGARTGVFLETISSSRGGNVENWGTFSDSFLDAFFFYYLEP